MIVAIDDTLINGVQTSSTKVSESEEYDDIDILEGKDRAVSYISPGVKVSEFDYSPVFTPPIYTWKCEISRSENFVVNFEEGHQPNFFHRFMQNLVFGFKWERINNK